MPPTRTHLNEVPVYLTKDGSSIRELMHPALHGNLRQSLAEARVPPGGRTLLHRHHETEEIYFFLAGTGQMTLGDEEFAIRPGDTVLIPPGTPHCLRNTGDETLCLLCACAPAYRHEDTEVLTKSAGGSTAS